MKKIIISTGGTGGHVIPAQVLYDYLISENEIIITSDKRGSNFLNKKKYNTKQIDVPKLKKNIIRFIPFLFAYTLSIVKSYFFLKKNKTKIIISTGGYMSVPICLAARILNLRIFLFEPNLVIGRANLFLLNYCEKILTYNKKIKNLPKEMGYKNFVLNPLISKNIVSSKNKPKKKSKIFTILIIGGSQGARSFDSLFNNDIVRLSRRFKIKIIHQTNKENIKSLKKFYYLENIDSEVFSYSNKLYKKIQTCEFVITRSGASTINELVFLKAPFLAIPYPFAKDDHQFYNADYYVKKNLGWLIREDEIKQNFLYKFIMNLIKNKSLLIQKKKNMHKFHIANNWKRNSYIVKNLIKKK